MPTFVRKRPHNFSLMFIFRIPKIYVYKFLVFTDFQNEANKAVAAFVSGLQAATPLHIALDVENTKDVQR